QVQRGEQRTQRQQQDEQDRDPGQREDDLHVVAEDGADVAEGGGVPADQGDGPGRRAGPGDCLDRAHGAERSAADRVDRQLQVELGDPALLGGPAGGDPGDPRNLGQVGGEGGQLRRGGRATAGGDDDLGRVQGPDREPTLELLVAGGGLAAGRVGLRIVGGVVAQRAGGQGGQHRGGGQRDWDRPAGDQAGRSAGGPGAARAGAPAGAGPPPRTH